MRCIPGNGTRGLSRQSGNAYTVHVKLFLDAHPEGGQDAVDDEGIGILQERDVLPPLALPPLDESVPVQEVVHVPVSVGLGIDGPLVVVPGDAESRIGILERGDLVLADDLDLVGVHPKVLVVMEELAREGIGVAAGHDDEGYPHVGVPVFLSKYVFCDCTYDDFLPLCCSKIFLQSTNKDFTLLRLLRKEVPRPFMLWYICYETFLAPFFFVLLDSL